MDVSNLPHLRPHYGKNPTEISTHAQPLLFKDLMRPGEPKRTLQITSSQTYASRYQQTLPIANRNSGSIYKSYS
jgi:hypothetical protein